jgi:hypothetical protein
VQQQQQQEQLQLLGWLHAQAPWILRREVVAVRMQGMVLVAQEQGQPGCWLGRY